MRLHKFTIGSEQQGPAHRFKNLKNLTVDFDQDHWVTIVIGRNGTGKSNVLEALSIIFGELISEGRPEIPFSFKLTYSIGKGTAKRLVHIDHDPDLGRRSAFRISAKPFSAGTEQQKLFAHGVEELHEIDESTMISMKQLRETDGYLPAHVFGYYSGESPRMRTIFERYLAKYDAKLRGGVDPGPKRLFFALPEHSQFVLLSFLIQQSDRVKQFLDEELGLDPQEGIESVLFVLNEPPWGKTSKGGDARFWNAKGVVQAFLDRLLDAAVAPISISRRTSVSPWNSKTLEYKYLFLKDLGALRDFVGSQKPASFFRDLESTHVSQLIEEIRIRVRLNKNDGAVTFRELSEGEQQLLTVLGLMLFTAQEESLFLLDEPDTHLNPRWSVDYIRYLKEFVVNEDEDESQSHVILTTHNPIAIAELEREQVQILRMDETTQSRRVVACFPDEAPRGMGYAAIVTSDMFGINSDPAP